VSGYTPLFSSLTTGTLCGKWPDIGLWPVILSIADRHGVVDVTHQYIATVTGLDHDDVVACMERFCQPDLRSRSQEREGARLVLLEPHRDWGWKIVNHGKYSEKARLIHKNAREVEDGRNRARMAEKRETAENRREPPTNAPQTQAQYQSQDKKTARNRAVFVPPKPDEVRAYCRERGNTVDPDAFVDFYTAKGWKVGREPMKDWQAAVRTWEKRATVPTAPKLKLLVDQDA
jgi:hypothetical protein